MGRLNDKDLFYSMLSTFYGVLFSVGGKIYAILDIL